MTLLLDRETTLAGDTLDPGNVTYDELQNYVGQRGAAWVRNSGTGHIRVHGDLTAGNNGLHQQVLTAGGGTGGVAAYYKAFTKPVTRLTYLLRVDAAQSASIWSNYWGLRSFLTTAGILVRIWSDPGLPQVRVGFTPNGGGTTASPLNPAQSFQDGTDYAVEILDDGAEITVRIFIGTLGGAQFGNTVVFSNATSLGDAVSMDSADIGLNDPESVIRDVLYYHKENETLLLDPEILVGEDTYVLPGAGFTPLASYVGQLGAGWVQVGAGAGTAQVVGTTLTPDGLLISNSGTRNRWYKAVVNPIQKIQFLLEGFDNGGGTDHIIHFGIRGSAVGTGIMIRFRFINTNGGTEVAFKPDGGGYGGAVNLGLWGGFINRTITILDDGTNISVDVPGLGVVPFVNATSLGDNVSWGDPAENGDAGNRTIQNLRLYRVPPKTRIVFA